MRKLAVFTERRQTDEHAKSIIQNDVKFLSLVPILPTAAELG